MTTATQVEPWLLNGAPGDGDHLLFGFPYAGVGASSYRDWPRRVGTGHFCPLQPPGKENRSRERAPADHDAFAEDLVGALVPHLDRPYAFLGHCGAFPYMLATTQCLVRCGLPRPERIFASSWGAPHRGLYGRLNFVDLETTDMRAEVGDIAARLGRPLLPDLAELAAEFLLEDLWVQRGYRYDGDPPVPVPVTVIAWDRDDVVPPATALPGWSECAQATSATLPGDHGEFFRCPEALVRLVERDMTGVGGAR